jgi:glucose-1-phosphate adenylyltransferase
VRVNSYTAIDDSILLLHAEIGRHCHLRRAIVCPNVKLPEGTRAGFDAKADRAAGYTVTESGITVIAG